MKRRRDARYVAIPFDVQSARTAQEALKILLTHQRDKVLMAYSTRGNIDGVLEEDDIQLKHTVETMQRCLFQATLSTVHHAAERLGNTQIVPRLEAWAQSFATERSASMFGYKIEKAGARNTRDTTKDITDRLVAQALEKGWTVKRLASELEKTGAFDEVRAMMIARTEINAAQNTAVLRAGYEFNEEADDVTEYCQKIWLCGPEPCEVCIENEGVLLDLDEVFESGHHIPPVHPNCMCEVLLVKP